MVNKMHFGKRISVLRRKAGLSQTELAERLGVTSQAVSKWECGNAVPDIDMLLELSHLYKVTINEMLEDVDLLQQRLLPLLLRLLLALRLLRHEGQCPLKPDSGSP